MSSPFFYGKKFVYYTMVQQYKNLSKGWKRLIVICGALATIASGIQGYKVIKEEVMTSIKFNTTPYIQEVVKEELETQKKSKISSYRYQKSAALQIPIDSLLTIDRKMYLSYLKSNHLAPDVERLIKDRAAFDYYLKILSMYIWRELEAREYKGIVFGYSEQTKLTFYLFEGYIFEAYYKGSTDSYWFRDAYENEYECN